jgi:hypothetical protein
MCFRLSRFFYADISQPCQLLKCLRLAKMSRCTLVKAPTSLGLVPCQVSAAGALLNILGPELERLHKVGRNQFNHGVD